MKTVLLWMDQYPLHGYGAGYEGHRRLTKEDAEQIAQMPMTLAGLLRIHEAQLLLQLKASLGGQFDIRNAILDHIYTTPLTPRELFLVGKIFGHSATLEVKLIVYAVHATVDFMDEAMEDGNMSQVEFDELIRVCNAVTVLKEKMDVARKGKQARLERQEAKAARKAEQKALRDQQWRANAPYRKVKRELERGQEQAICEDSVDFLMCGPAVIKTVYQL